ncbi:MAG: hypothetical protein ACK5XS_09965 [Armatimonadota bacterium]|jgi:hypothetical protein|nr:J domain-containing protein [Fimbriimonadaceae bacterium]MCZ8138512.1 J domain-containing protein [Fimbriimonadaceae bacterium]
MKDAQRVVNVLRSYIGREWERVKEIEKQLARDELNQATATPGGQPPASPPAVPSTSAPAASGSSLTEADLDRQARAILGVEPYADFPTIRKAYEKLEKRSRPGKFPEGSPESNVAAALRARVDWAFKFLSRHASEVEKRFSSLEID